MVMSPADAVAGTDAEAGMPVVDPDHAPARADEDHPLRLGADHDDSPGPRDVTERPAPDDDTPPGTIAERLAADDDPPGVRDVTERLDPANDDRLRPADQDHVRRPPDEAGTPRAYEDPARPPGAVQDDLPAGAALGIAGAMCLTARGRDDEADPERHCRDP
jgi:hypothetical protein